MTARRIVALTAPEGQYLRFHELRLQALVDELKQRAAGCGLQAERVQDLVRASTHSG